MQYPELRYVPEAEDPSLTIETRDLVTRVIDNTGLLAPPIPADSKAYFNSTGRFTPFTHHLGYHGIRTLYDKRERRNVVAPFISWLNLQMAKQEGIPRDPVDERSAHGTGRGWPMRMEQRDRGALFTIEPMPLTRFRYTLELQPAEPDGIDFSVRFEFHRHPETGPVKFTSTWPCYVNAYDDVRLFYPRGRSLTDWRWESIAENAGMIIGETVGYEHKQTEFHVAEQAFPLAYGRIGAHALVLMFDDPGVEFYCVNAGGHSFMSAVQNPAWDFAWVIEDYPLNKPVGFNGRILYTPFKSPEQILQRYQEWEGSRLSSGR